MPTILQFDFSVKKKNHERGREREREEEKKKRVPVPEYSGSTVHSRNGNVLEEIIENTHPFLWEVRIQEDQWNLCPARIVEMAVAKFVQCS